MEHNNFIGKTINNIMYMCILDKLETIKPLSADNSILKSICELPDMNAMDMIDLLLSDSKFNAFVNLDVQFVHACSNGELIIAKKLHKAGANVNYNNSAALVEACTHSKIDIIDWLISLDSMNIHVNDEMAFMTACSVGDLGLAKKLYNMGANYTINNSRALITACRCKQIEIIDWLITLNGIDIHINNDMAFRFACSTGEFELARKLYKMDAKFADLTHI